jgi:predicted DNA-binding protein
MEPFPLHYSRHLRAEEPTDPVLRRVLEEIHNLGDKIDGRCGGLEQRVTEAKQCFKERLITLEMARTESKVTRVELEKRLDGLRLEVGQTNRLLERENLENIRDMADIFLSVDSRAVPPPLQGTYSDGGRGHHSDAHG